jgi:GntR family transcriptional regulator/MocR family aminotransferase
MKRITSLNLILQLPESCATKQVRIYTALQEAITSGTIAPNQRLPSTREFACALGISRGTAVIVYEMLQAEGYLVARRGTGTFVAPTLPDDRLILSEGGPQIDNSPQRAERVRAAADALPSIGRQFASTRLTRLMGDEATRHPVPFVPYMSALSEFPINLWARLTARHARLVKPNLLDHGCTAGWPRLRTAIAAYLRATRGIDCQREQIVLTSSTQQSLSLCARLLAERGDEVLIEDPGNPEALALLQEAGLAQIPVPVDAQGMQIDTVRFGGRARLAYVTPAHQYPTGAVMSVNRRRALLDWADRHNGWIFEDDDSSEFRYSGHPLPALYGMGRKENVLFAGSFDKTLFPALCISYLVVPSSLVDTFAHAQALFGRHPTILSQLVLCDFIESGHFVRHVRRMAECYRERRAALIEALNRQFGNSIEIAPQPCGLALPVWWRWRDARTIAKIAEAQGLRVVPIPSAPIHMPARSGAVLGFAAYSASVLHNAVERLAGALETNDKAA